jgi:hypothetical protein
MRVLYNRMSNNYYNSNNKLYKFNNKYWYHRITNKLIVNVLL